MWQHSHQPDDGFIGEYEAEIDALQAGRAMYGSDHVVYTVEVQTLRYSDFVDPPRVLVAEWKARQDEDGQDASCFDALTQGDLLALGEVVRKSIDNWEEWMVRENPDKACTIVRRGAVRRHPGVG